MSSSDTPQKVWYRKNKGKQKKQIQAKRAELGEFYKKYLLTQIKNRARRRSIPFDLTIDDINIPEYCPIFGIKLRYNPDKRLGDDSPSVDRIVPEVGYVRSNIIVISLKANKLKQNATLEEMKRLCEFYENEVPEAIQGKVLFLP